MINQERLQRHLRFFATETPDRAAGSPGEAKAMDYAVAELVAAGWAVSYEPLQTFSSQVRKTQVEVADGPTFPAMGIGYATPRGQGRWLELIGAGDGSVAAYAGQDAAGKTVLVASGGPGVPDKGFIAHRHGALALLLASPATPEPTFALRAQKGVWGPPQPEDLLDLPDVTAVALTHRDALALAALLRDRPRLQVRLHPAAEAAWRELRQPIASLGPADGEFVLLHGHIDGWSPGVTDNATGCAALLEVARALAQGPALRRGLRLALWTGHEVEEASGSAAFVDRHWRELRRCAAHLNVDSPGCEGGERVVLYRSLELRSVAQEVLGRFGVEVASELPLAKESDNSFALAGVPGIGVVPTGEAGRTLDGEEVAPLWWMHTERDGTEHVREDLLLRDTALLLELARTLADAPRLHDFLPVLSLLSDVVRGIPDEELRQELGAATARLAAAGGAGARSLSRLLLAVLGTRGGRWRHDRYGDPLYAYEYPGIAHLLGAPAEEHALEAARLRERNRLADFLHAALTLEVSSDG